MEVGNSGSDLGDWYARLAESVDGIGGIESLGNGYTALTTRQSSTLLVTFESVDKIRAARLDEMPFASVLAEDSGMSQLTVISERRAWFRDPAVYDYFDRLIDEGFFDDFSRVVFYGAGMCGYAAAAFSVAAPGSTVIAVTPVATLDPEVAGWDKRYFRYRRLNFTTRYGYGPDMLDAADQAYILYDPYKRPDAMHAALFTRPHVHKLRCRHMGPSLETDLLNMGVLSELLDAACEGQISPQVFSQLYRARRSYPPYISRLQDHLETEERVFLGALLSRDAVTRIGRPSDQKRFDQLEAQLLQQGRTLPPAGGARSAS